jgi:hypothetical protein
LSHEPKDLLFQNPERSNIMVAHKDEAPVAPKAPKEPTIVERAQALLDHVNHSAEHNAPLTREVVVELTAVINGLMGHKAPHA